MGKRLKKGRTPPSGNRSAAVSMKVTEQSGQSEEMADEALVVAVTEKRSCVHFDKGVDLDKLLAKIKSSQQIKCGECKEGVHLKRGGSKGKVNIGKNGFSSSDAKTAKKAIWVCLDCGHYVCGGVGLPTGAQSHVMRHIRLTRHRLVIQCEKPQLRWCFPCQSLLPFEKEENGEKKDLLLEVVKLIKERASNPNSALADSEDSCSGTGSITSATKLEARDSYAVSSGLGARDGYAVRGLANLGNTCFFNSVMQNLLSLDQLREHFLKDDMSGGGVGGPLVSSLKKLFSETKSELGFFKSVINPKAFFASVCSKAPQFKGYQQHDSHELLRCLLDGLSIEESSLRKNLGVSDSDDSSSTHEKPTFIDSVFGGEISSTVSCLECGHSSKVYEPFLDLSLPVPSKKPAPKKQQTVSLAKKGKILPKKVLKNGAVSKNSEIVSAKPALDHNSIVSVIETPSAMAPENKQSEIATETDTEFDSFWLDIIGPETSQNETDMVSQGNISDTAPATQAEEVVSSGDQTLVASPETLIHDKDGSAKPAPDPSEEDAGALQSNEDSPASGISEEIDKAQVCGDPELGQSSSSVNPWDDEELPLMVADSQVLYMPYYNNDDIFYDNNTAAESKEGEASSSFVSGNHHEQTKDDVDFNRFFDEPGMSCNDKTVGEREGEASSSVANSGHEENVDYVDFGGLFDEPEVTEGPVFGPLSRAEVSETSFMAFSSDSDPEVLDDSDSPVSVDRCLAHFTKPEILSDDNAWHCENCSKNLKLQQLRENRKSNENGASSASDECRNNPSNQTGTALENGYKAAPNSELPNCNEEENAIDDEILVGSDTKQPPIASSATESPISSQLDNGKESEKGEDGTVDSEKVIVKRDATKRVLVNKAPLVLTVHLKRFSQDARGRLSKLSGHVDFTEFIDLRQYMDSRLTEEEDQPVYRLAGLVEHSGTMRGGHYVAYIRGGHKERRNSDAKEPNSSIWYHASDSYVRRASFEEVLRSEAYILFYERI